MPRKSDTHVSRLFVRDHPKVRGMIQVGWRIILVDGQVDRPWGACTNEGQLQELIADLRATRDNLEIIDERKRTHAAQE